jgi:hypothetical protein
VSSEKGLGFPTLFPGYNVLLKNKDPKFKPRNPLNFSPFRREPQKTKIRKSDGASQVGRINWKLVPKFRSFLTGFQCLFHGAPRRAFSGIGQNQGLMAYDGFRREVGQPSLAPKPREWTRQCFQSPSPEPHWRGRTSLWPLENAPPGLCPCPLLARLARKGVTHSLGSFAVVIHW